MPRSVPKYQAPPLSASKPSRSPTRRCRPKVPPRGLQGNCGAARCTGAPGSASRPTTGFSSVTKAEDIYAVGRTRRRTPSASNILIADHAVPVDLIQADVHRDGPPRTRPRRGPLPARFTRRRSLGAAAIVRSRRRRDRWARGARPSDLVTTSHGPSSPGHRRLVGSIRRTTTSPGRSMDRHAGIGFGDPDLIRRVSAADIEGLTADVCESRRARRRSARDPGEDMLSVSSTPRSTATCVPTTRSLRLVLLIAAATTRRRRLHDHDLGALMENPDQRRS